jgi:hypothetical protein
MQNKRYGYGLVKSWLSIWGGGCGHISFVHVIFGMSHFMEGPMTNTHIYLDQEGRLASGVCSLRAYAIVYPAVFLFPAMEICPQSHLWRLFGSSFSALPEEDLFATLQPSHASECYHPLPFSLESSSETNMYEAEGDEGGMYPAR